MSNSSRRLTLLFANRRRNNDNIGDSYSDTKNKNLTTKTREAAHRRSYSAPSSSNLFEAKAEPGSATPAESLQQQELNYDYALMYNTEEVGIALTKIGGGGGGGARREKEEDANFSCPDHRDDSDNCSFATQSSTQMHWITYLYHFIVELIIFTKNRSWKKKILTIAIVASSIYVLVDLIFLGHVHNIIVTCLEWFATHPAYAVFCFLGLFVLCTFLFVPPAFLYFGAGYVFSQMTNMGFGILAATIVCYVGSFLGAVLAFYRARYMMRDIVLLFAKRFPIIKAADRAFERNGFRVMLLLRLCPVVPFNGLNYIGGVLSVSPQEFTRALVGIVPSMMLWVYCGATSRALNQARLSDSGDGIKMSWILLLGSGIGFGIIALAITWKVAIQELAKEIALDSAENWFRYKRHKVGVNGEDEEDTLTQVSDLEEFMEQQGIEVVASRYMLDIEEQLQQQHEADAKGPRPRHRRRWTSFLPFVGINTHHLDDHYEGPEDDTDEDPYWLFA